MTGRDFKGARAQDRPASLSPMTQSSAARLTVNSVSFTTYYRVSLKMLQSPSGFVPDITLTDALFNR
jgi:hypothetical protein